MRTFDRSSARLAAVGAAALAAAVAGRGDGSRAQSGEPWAVRALAPVQVLASGFVHLSSVTVEPSGAVLVTDRAAGTLTRVHEGGGREVLLDGLHAPSGVTIDRAGRIIVVEAAARRVLRLDPGAGVTVIASALRQPGRVAAGPDGGVWLAMRGETEADDVVARLEESGALTSVASGFINIESLAATTDAVYVAMERFAHEHGDVRTAVARIPIGAEGVAGPIEPVVSLVGRRALGLAVDGLGELFVGAQRLGEEAGAGSLYKNDRDGRLHRFAEGLRHPIGLAFAAGDLIAVEERHPGRVFRFRAPPPPAPAAPAFTNRTRLPIAGRAHPGDRVELFRRNRAESIARATADARGDFTLLAVLDPNAATQFLLHATAAGGVGLTSAGAAATVTHDDIPPRVLPVEPAAGVHVRDAIAVRARAEDEGSGVDAVTVLLDDAVVARVANDAPPSPVVASLVVATAAAAEGPHALTMAALDRAGNSAAEARLLVVDRTPPETAIARGTGSHSGGKDVRFGISGSDEWAPTLEFSWRLDEGAWSPYAADSTVVLTNLAPGPHRLAARARDLAGNEDPTPAVETFTAQLLGVRILEPRDKQVITSDAVLVRGVIDGAADPVAVTVALPPELGGSLSVPVEGGTFALEIPAEVAPATLSVTVVDESGATARQSVSIVLQPDGSSIESLDVWPPGGLAPLPVRVRLPGFAGMRVAVDVEGDGASEFDGPLDGDEFRSTYERAGIYVPTVRITTLDGGVLTRRAHVEVYDRTVLDRRLQAVWSGFKEALRRGDVEAAVSFIVAERRAAWAEYFRALSPGTLMDVDQTFPAIALVEVGAGGAQYEVAVERGGQMLSYPVWFQIDADGRWRLWRF